ncbi:MAG: hypothetical protein HY347_11475 [candidate division NC10 bacterium]|nr:hypothetical protein [candidate division NC10 bacterium]
MRDAFYDLKTLLTLRDLIQGLDPKGPPDLILVFRDPSRPTPDRLGILPGAFNPFTNAHLDLALRSMATYELHELLFTISKATIDKETITGACLEDRLLLLLLMAKDHLDLGVVLTNKGLYVEQAKGLHRRFPSAQLFFVVGFDKVLQIFDPRYYDDRDAALRALFEWAFLVVGSRSGKGRRDLQAFLQRPENRPFREKVLPLELPETVQHLSSTLVREKAKRGDPINDDVPELVKAFIQETKVYALPQILDSGEEVDAYALRVALLDAFARARPWAEEQGDFLELLRLALRETEEGRALRTLLRHLPGWAHHLPCLARLNVLGF